VTTPTGPQKGGKKSVTRSQVAFLVQGSRKKMKTNEQRKAGENAAIGHREEKKDYLKKQNYKRTESSEITDAKRVPVVCWRPRHRNTLGEKKRVVPTVDVGTTLKKKDIKENTKQKSANGTRRSAHYWDICVHQRGASFT